VALPMGATAVLEMVAEMPPLRKDARGLEPLAGAEAAATTAST
jgi:hypothetical protein